MQVTTVKICPDISPAWLSEVSPMKQLSDNEGPEIKLFMNDTLFRNGGITGNNPTLLALIEDKVRNKYNRSCNWT